MFNLQMKCCGEARIERFDNRVREGLVIEVKRWRGLVSLTVKVGLT